MNVRWELGGPRGDPDCTNGIKLFHFSLRALGCSRSYGWVRLPLRGEAYLMLSNLVKNRFRKRLRRDHIEMLFAEFPKELLCLLIIIERNPHSSPFLPSLFGLVLASQTI